MSQNSQLHLTNDAFIYACQSEYAARSKKDGSFQSHLRFEDFLTNRFHRQENPTNSDVAKLFTSIAQHHVRITPQFRRREPINLETVSFFTCSIATLFADLESACKELYGIGLPKIPVNPPEYSTEAPLSSALLNARTEYVRQLNSATVEAPSFAAFPRSEFPALNGEQQEQIWACEVWDLLADILHSVFGEYADAAMGFAYWKYQETPGKLEIDWRVRPPVGEAYAKAFKPLQRAGRGDRPDRGGDRRGRGDRAESRGNGERPKRAEHREHGEKPGRADHREHRERPERAEHSTSADALSKPEARTTKEPRQRTEGHEPTEARQRTERHEPTEPRQRTERPDRGPRSERVGRREQNDRRERHGGVGSTGSATSEQQLLDALEEVRQATAKLKSNPELREISLEPSNSYIRRHQHSLAVELGFDTESRGEGRDRGVVIKTLLV